MATAISVASNQRLGSKTPSSGPLLAALVERLGAENELDEARRGRCRPRRRAPRPAGRRGLASARDTRTPVVISSDADGGREQRGERRLSSRRSPPSIGTNTAASAASANPPPILSSTGAVIEATIEGAQDAASAHRLGAGRRRSPAISSTRASSDIVDTPSPPRFRTAIAVARLAVAPDDDVRHLLQLRVPDPLAERLVALVDLGPDALAPKRVDQLVRRRPMPVGDRDDAHLHGRQPGRGTRHRSARSGSP